MSAPNFSFQNRCVLITNADYEEGNIPELGTWDDGDRSYPAREIAESSDLKTVKVVITSGYYSDACLDYIKTGKDLLDFINYDYYLSDYTRKELVNEIQYFFPWVSTRLINKVFKGCDRRKEDNLQRIQDAVYHMNEIIEEQESKMADKMIDRIKKKYCYRELCCKGIFSNGEAIYDFIK